jgi:GDP-4-dehydro-6-deoxy-D-mannose reductase
MTARVLIVGGTGFVGRHLAAQLAPRYAVAASGREVDVREAQALWTLVSKAQPDIVVNLAAITTVRETVDDPRRTYATAVQGLQNLLEALAAEGFAGRLLQVSSSEVYGFPAPEALPLTEDAALRPMSPYAVAKVMAEMLCRQWTATAAFDILTARPFTHIGPGQSDRFATASFARQIAEIEAGLRAPVINVGRLDATRDLTDVRDVARAYEAILERGVAGATYNVCSGTETTMRTVLDALIARSGLKIEVVEDAGLVRGAEQQRLCGSHARLRADTGWAPQIPLALTLSDILEDSLQRVRTDTRRPA